MSRGLWEVRDTCVVNNNFKTLHFFFLKHSFFFFHAQLFPVGQACKIIFGYSKNVVKVGVRKVFLKIVIVNVMLNI